jgi:anti-sigma B factor antagonist
MHGGVVMEGIQVSIDKVDLSPDTFLIKVGGYVDTTTSQELDRTIEELLKKDVIRFVIDLEDVDYISSAGWGIFISEIKSIRRKGGDIKLVKMAPDVFEVFELLEFHRILKSYHTVDDALFDFKENVKTAEIQENTVETPVKPIIDDITIQSDKESPADDSTLSLEDRIRKIVSENPEFGIRDIQRKLITDRYGNLNIGFMRVYMLLRKCGLASMKKRIVFARSKIS